MLSSDELNVIEGYFMNSQANGADDIVPIAVNSMEEIFFFLNM